MYLHLLKFSSRHSSEIGWLILGFYFTSKNLLVKLHLLVKPGFTSKTKLSVRMCAKHNTASLLT